MSAANLTTSRTDVDISSAVASIELATQRALDSLQPASTSANIRSTPFESVWVGLAGYDRPEVKFRINSVLSDVFKIPSIESFKVTDDIHAMANAIGNKTSVNSAIVLIAGTGSVAMSYQQLNGGDFVRRARCGGWGHLLGDDGGGFDIGRQGIRVTLSAADELKAGMRKTSLSSDPLPQLIFEHFNLPSLPETNNPGPEYNHDLLSTILMNSNNPHDQKSTIANVAKVVLSASSTSPSAQKIIASGTASLARTLRQLIPASPTSSPNDFDPSNATLVLGGSLLSRSKIYRDALLAELGDLKFKHVEIVEKPANAGARFLHQKMMDSKGGK